jgi:peptide/nickel transport system ATP-binding protein
MCDRLGVMNHGELLEELPVDALERGDTANPYTRQLLTASLGYDRRLAADVIEG